jgi:adenine-specific DNA-methyltransferase
MAQRGRPSKATTKELQADSYRHPEAESLSRPEAGTQAQFKKKKAPARYRYDSSLSPSMEWDGQNAVRELGEWLLACVQEAAKLPAPHAFDSPRDFVLNDGSITVTVRDLNDAVERLSALAKPFLNWTGKAEIKRQAANRWINTVNADGRFGKWSHEMVRDIGEVKKAIDDILDKNPR